MILSNLDFRLNRNETPIETPTKKIDKRYKLTKASENFPFV